MWVVNPIIVLSYASFVKALLYFTDIQAAKMKKMKFANEKKTLS